jgi:hypothetical protein
MAEFPLVLSPPEQAFFDFLRRAYCPLSANPPTGLVNDAPDYPRELNRGRDRWRAMCDFLNYGAFLKLRQ